MAKKKVIVEGQVILDDKGTLKNTAKGAHSVDRRLKGAARTSSNATKNFSKMSQGIAGGLVPAYATLAANIFAIGAAFRFLSDAANYRILIEGQREYANTTGQSLELLTGRLQEATGQQLAFNDAAQATAIAAAAGVTADQLIRIGHVAKNASIALGRDLTDSLNRLVRGVTKAEPELLDELGIILRLEVAGRKYADQLGKTVQDLTIFEKSQAVVNEVLSQGEEKFGEFNTGLNEMAKLAKSFDDLMNSIKINITKFAEFIGKGLSRNVMSLAAAFSMLGSGVAKAILPMPQAHPGETFARAERDVGQWYTGKDAEKFRTGQYGSKEISRLERTIGTDAAKEGRSSVINYERFKRNEARKTLQILKLQALEREQYEGNSYQRMKARWKFTLETMKAEYGAFVGTVKALGVGLMKLVSWAGYAGLIFSGFSLVKEWVSRMGDPAVNEFTENQIKIAEALEKQAVAVKELNANLANTSTYMSKVVQLSKFMGNFAWGQAAGGFGATPGSTVGKGGSGGFWKTAEQWLMRGAVAGTYDPSGDLAASAAEYQSQMTLSSGQLAIIKQTTAALEVQRTTVKDNSESAADLDERMSMFTDTLKAIADADGVVTKEQFETLSKGLQDLGENGTVAEQKLRGFGQTAQILTDNVQTFTKAIGGLRGANTHMGKVATSIQNIGDTLVGLGRADLKDFIDLAGTFEDAFDTATATAVEQFIGKDKFDEIMEKRGAPKGFGTRYTDQDILELYGMATQKRAKELADMEIRHLTDKMGIETRYMQMKSRQPKLIQQQLDKEMKVELLTKQQENNIEKINEYKALGAEKNAAAIAQVEAENAKLTEQIKLAKEASSFAGQAYKVFVDTLGSSLTQALNDFATGAKNMKEAFLDMTQAILKAMIQILAQQAALNILGVFGFGGGTAATKTATKTTSSVGWGGSSFSSGGIVGNVKPYYFSSGGYAKGSDTVPAMLTPGEAVLTPKQIGNLVNNSTSMGTNNVTVNVDAAGGQATTNVSSAQAKVLGQMVASAVQAEIIDAKRPGGPLSPYGDGDY